MVARLPLLQILSQLQHACSPHVSLAKVRYIYTTLTAMQHLWNLGAGVLVNTLRHDPVDYSQQTVQHIPIYRLIISGDLMALVTLDCIAFKKGYIMRIH